MEYNITNSELPNSIHENSSIDDFKYNDFIVPEIKTEQIIIPEVGNSVPLDFLLESLFGTSDIEFPRLEYLRNGFTLNYNGRCYFVVKEIIRFIQFMTNAKNFNYKDISNMCPINYYILNGMLNDKSIPYYGLINKLFQFRNYLIENKQEELLCLFWPKFFKGKVTAFVKEPLMMVLLFPRPTGRSLTLNIIEVNSELRLLVESNTTSILEKKVEEIKSINDSELFGQIVEEWNNNIKMDNGDQFIINNLSRVIGSTDMAKFIFESNKRENDFVIRISDINSIISFKSIKFKKEYYEYFKELYPHLVKDDSEYIGFLNFEGFNKYLLNLNPAHLTSFSEKEMINEMYYSITKELISCYRKLYNYHKLV